MRSLAVILTVLPLPCSQVEINSTTAFKSFCSAAFVFWFSGLWITSISDVVDDKGWIEGWLWVNFVRGEGELCDIFVVKFGGELCSGVSTESGFPVGGELCSG